MGMFDSKSQSAAFRERDGANFAPGQYVLKIDACKFFKGNSGNTFVVEGTVLGVSSNDPEAPQPGDAVSSVWMEGDKDWMKEKFMMRWWSFLEAATGEVGSGYNDGDWKTASDRALEEPNSSLEGVILAVKGLARTKTGYCGVKWQGAPTPEQLATCGLDSVPAAAAPAPAPAAALPEYAKDAAGADIISLDGRKTWKHVNA